MCDGRSYVPSSPQDELSALMKRELGVEIDPRLLKMFIRFKWAAVSRLAHAIHDGDKPANSSTTNKD